MSHFDDEENYWAAPESSPRPKSPHPSGNRPAVYTWFLVYCVVMGLFALMILSIGVTMLFLPQEDLEEEAALLMGLLYIVLGSIFLVLYLLAPFLPNRPWVWTYDLILICLGLANCCTNCCTIPACVPLLIFWIKPETQAYFGRGINPPPY